MIMEWMPPAWTRKVLRLLWCLRRKERVWIIQMEDGTFEVL